MFFKLFHGSDWIYKVRKKKPGMKVKINKNLKSWLKENISNYKIIKDGPLSGIVISDLNEALIYKLRWLDDRKKDIISFLKSKIWKNI